MNKSDAKLFELIDLKKDYVSGESELPVLRGVNLTLDRRQISFVIGRSGSGKSTLLHLLGGLDQPTSGSVIFEGQNISEMDDDKLSKIRNRKIGFVFLFYHLLPELTLYENVMLPSLIHGKEDKVWVRELLKRVKLLSRQHHLPAELSGGEKQRAAIARALVNHPSVLLCDEPTGNLDSETADSVFTLLEDLNRSEGLALVIVTHDESLAWRYPNVFRMQDGLLHTAVRGNAGGKIKVNGSF